MYSRDHQLQTLEAEIKPDHDLTIERDAVPKPQRIRDVVHDLIEFGIDDFEQTAWSSLNSAEFQRLRRIKQLGFSELTFPGATHSRFAHSVGVFHTARRLSSLLQSRLGTAFDSERANVAIMAALVHDLGHGPFSHAFEEALKGLGVKKRHEDWTAEIVRGDTEVHAVLSTGGERFVDDVAGLLASETPTDIYSSIVSSQFDADRLDYVRRDRMMTGTQHGGFDFFWLMANLEVDRIAISQGEDTFGEVDSLILGNKAFQAAEAYVLGLFHLYFTVYFHKATRSAEKMMSAIFQRVGRLASSGEVRKTGLTPKDPIILFLADQSLRSYLALNDYVVWGAIQQMQHAADTPLAELASRLLNRRLYKAVDVTARLAQKGGDAAVARFRAKLGEARKERFAEFELFEDHATRNPYKRRGYDSPEALSKVLIRRRDGNGYEDLAERSKVVEHLNQQSVYRVYVKDEDVAQRVDSLLREVAP